MRATDSRPSSRSLAVDETYPRLLQAGFATLIGLDVAARLAADDGYPLVSWPALGLFLAVVATVATAVATLRPGLAGALLVVPLLDMAALGFLRIDPEGGGTSALVVLPALWLGRRHGRAGAVVAVVGSALLVSLPGLLQAGTATGPQLARALVVPVVAGLVAATVAITLEALRARTALAEERGVRLEAALTELRRAARRSETLLETVDVGMVLLDADGSYRTVNRRHRDFLALAYPSGHGGVAGQSGAVYAEDRRTPLPPDRMPASRACTGEEFDDVRIWVGEDPATQRALSVSARAVRADDGTLEGAVLAYHDVTELLRALEVKDDFVATVSHELRTPLTSIIGYLDVLEDRADLDAEVRAHLDRVARNATRLLGLVSDLLHPAAAGPAGLRLRPLPEDLADLVQEAVDLAGPLAHDAGVRIEVTGAPEVPVVADRAHLVEALGRVLSNAVKYNRPGGRVQVAVLPEAGAVVVEVRDTGVGMTPEEREQLFSRFFRGTHARQQAVQGVGLGLSIARAVVEEHGGHIEVDSAPGAGTTVRVHLPRPAGLDTGEERRFDAPAWD